MVSSWSAVTGNSAAQPTYAARATKMAVNRYLRWMVDQTLDVSLAYEAISRGLPEYPAAVDAWKQRRANRTSPADEPRRSR